MSESVSDSSQLNSEPQRRLLVVACTYNERDNLPRLLEGINAAVPGADVLVIDDASPDGTGRWAVDQAQQNDWLTVIQRSGKLGLGSAIVAAMNYAIEHEYEYLVNLDGDLSHDPAKIPELVSKADSENADVVIGSRYIPGGAIDGWSRHRMVMSSILNGVARIGLGLKARDCSGAFRCYRVRALRDVDLTKIRATGYAMLEEILWLLSHRNAKIVEIPITFTNRTHGNSKLSLGEAVKSASVILRLAVSRRR